MRLINGWMYRWIALSWSGHACLSDSEYGSPSETRQKQQVVLCDGRLVVAVLS